MNVTNLVNIIDFQIFWSDNYGNNHLLYLPPTCHIFIKVMFRRKDFNGIEISK